MLHTVLYAIFVAVTLLVLQIKIIIFLTQNRIGEKTTVLLSDDKNLKQEKRNWLINKILKNVFNKSCSFIRV